MAKERICFSLNVIPALNLEFKLAKLPIIIPRIIESEIDPILIIEEKNCAKNPIKIQINIPYKYWE